MPDAAGIKALRDADPEAYNFWLDTVQKRVEHDMWIEKAPYELPYKLAARGQVAGIIGIVILSALTALAIVVGQPWVAGIFGVLDFVGIVAAFSRKDDEPRHRDLEQG